MNFLISCLSLKCDEKTFVYISENSDSPCYCPICGSDNIWSEKIEPTSPKQHMDAIIAGKVGDVS